MIERWRQVDPVIDTAEDEKRVYHTSDGRVFGGLEIVDTPDNVERLRQGRMCAHCREPLEEAWPERCPVCGVPVREEQLAYFGDHYEGETLVKGGFDEDEELARLHDELDRQLREGA